MSKSKHTPGDWIAVGDCVLTDEPDNQILACMSKHRNKRGRPGKEQYANARLMAASPKLLTACEACFKVLERRRIQDELEMKAPVKDGPQLAQLREAINQAKNGK